MIHLHKRRIYHDTDTAVHRRRHLIPWGIEGGFRPGYSAIERQATLRSSWNDRWHFRDHCRITRRMGCVEDGASVR